MCVKHFQRKLIFDDYLYTTQLLTSISHNSLFLFFFFFFFLSFVYLGPHLWHMDVPRLGIESEL